MFTKEQINEILRPWDSSLDERPLPTTEEYAYDEADREKAWLMEHDWQEPHIVMMDDDETLEDFICHQSDVIEMLAHALSFANKKLLKNKQEFGDNFKDYTVCGYCNYFKFLEGEQFGICSHRDGNQSKKRTVTDSCALFEVWEKD